MGDYIHLFNSLKKAIQMRDEDDENEDDDDEEIEDEEEELNVRPKSVFRHNSNEFLGVGRRC